MTYHISICDDEPAQCSLLKKMAETWAQSRQVMIQTDVFQSAEEFLFKEADRETEILLLDIEMGQMNGVELARKVRRENKEIQFIFVTGYMDYIQDGYDVEALHYLLKPVTEEKLFQVLDRAANRLQTSGKVLLLSSHGDTVRIPLYEIRYLEVRKNYVTVHAGEDVEVKMTLSELEEKLDESFCRTGRSFIINLRFVKRITKTEVILSDDTNVPLSRGMYEQVNQAMIRYF